MDPDGTNLVGLSPNGAPFEAHNGKFSWDGTRVVFVKKGDGDGLAYFQVNDPAGTMTVIPNTTNKDYWPVFSPDGQWVAFQRDLGSNLMQIYKIRLDGSNLTPLTDGFNRDEMPYFSPDGKYILFKRGDGQTVNMDIWRMNADGSGLVNLSNTPAINENGPCYSWDGAEIAYNGGGNGAYGTEIYTAHPDGSGSRTLTTDGNVNYYATFSPLAKRLAVPLALLLDD
jgi:TolB protein